MNTKYAFVIGAQFALVAPAFAQSWAPIATVSTTLDVHTDRLCVGAGISSTLGCPSYAPSLTTAGDISVTGNLSANKFYGDGSALTGISTSTDRITSGTTSILANDSGPISFTTAGTTAMVISGSNVGIGTTSPTAKLTVSNNTDALPGESSVVGTVAQFGGANNQSSRIILDNFSTTGKTTSNFSFRTAAGTAASPLAIRKNYVIGQLSWLGRKESDYSGATAFIRSTATEDWNDQATGTSLLFSTTQNSTTINSAKMIIGNDGNVGIGTIAPATKLEVAGIISSTGISVTGLISATTLAATQICDEVGSNCVDISNGFGSAADAADRITSGTTSILANDAGPISFTTAGTTAMVISGSNVGIGTSAPRQKLEVSGDIIQSWGSYFVGTQFGTSTGTYRQGISTDPYTRTLSLDVINGDAPIASGGIRFRVGPASSPDTKMFVRYDGNVGIGTTAPAQTLDVSGSSRVTSNSEVVGTISATEVKIASSNTACTPEKYGTLRFDPTTKRMFICKPR